MLTSSEWLLLAIIGGALVLILSNRLRTDVVSLLVMIALGATGILPVEATFAGLSQPVIITVFSLFVLARALEETGVVQWIGDRLRLLGGASETRLILAVMLVAIALSFFMNLVAVGALLLPATLQAARDSNIRPSKLLIPLSFGALLGGTATYFATANLLVNSVLRTAGYVPLAPTDYISTGLPIIILGMLYMAVIGRRFLPVRDTATMQASARSLSRNLYETYELEDRLWEFLVPPWTRLANTTLRESRIGEELGVTVLGIWRGHSAILTPEPDEVILPGDYLLILGREDRVNALRGWGLRLGRPDGARHYDPEHDYAVDLTEVVIPPRSTIVGKTLIDLRFRSKYGLTTVALWRGGRSYRTDVGKFPLQVGDALLMVGTPAQIRTVAQESDYVVLRSGHAARPRKPDKAPLALAIFAAAVIASLLQIVPPAEALLVGALAAILTGCLNIDEAYRAVEWRVIFTIAGMLPLSTALATTGLADRLGGFLVGVVAPYGDLVFLGVLYVLVMLITQGLSAQVTAVVGGTIAISAAAQVGVDPRLAALVTAAACSSGFLTQVSHPVNVLMVAPGGYRPSDFPRVGAGLVIVVFAALMIGLVVVWGVR
jgi:di/tricarboxylate transporter